jgi:hypothetical protein
MRSTAVSIKIDPHAIMGDESLGLRRPPQEEDS